MSNIGVGSGGARSGGTPTLTDAQLASIAAMVMSDPAEDGEDGEDGMHGQTPVLAIVEDGSRRVFRIAGYQAIDGTFTAVDDPNLYVGPNGVVADPSDAVNIRGLGGVGGRPGDVPVLGVVTNGDARVLQVAGYLDATETFTANTEMQFIGEDGIVDNVGGAVDIRGPQGEAGEGSGGNARGNLWATGTISAGDYPGSAEVSVGSVSWAINDDSVGISENAATTSRLQFPRLRPGDSIIGFWLTARAADVDDIFSEAYVPWHGPQYSTANHHQIEEVKITNDASVQVRIVTHPTQDLYYLAIYGAQESARRDIPESIIEIYAAVTSGGEAGRRAVRADEIIEDPPADGEALTWPVHQVKAAVELYETPATSEQMTAEGVVMNGSVYNATFWQESGDEPTFTSLLTENDEGIQSWSPDVGNWATSRPAAELAPGDEQMWIAYASGRRSPSGIYTHNIPTVVAEFDVQYRQGPGADITTVAPTGDLTGWQQRSRLPNSAWTVWAWIGPPDNSWNSIFTGQSVYATTNPPANHIRTLNVSPSIDLNNVDEMLLEVQAFGGFGANGIINPGGWTDYRISRPGDFWPTTSSLTHGATNAEFTVQYDEYYGLHVVHQDGGSVSDINWPVINRRPGNSPPRNAGYMMRLVATNQNAASILNNIVFWNFQGTYVRTRVSLYWR